MRERRTWYQFIARGRNAGVRVKRLLIAILTRAFSLVHPRVAPWLAWPLARLLWLLSTRLRTVALKNIGLCLPDLPQAERRRLARQAMQHYVRNILEAGIAWHWGRRRFLGLFESDRGGELLAEGIARGEGVLLLVPHHGAWELLGLKATAEMGGCLLYKPGADPGLEARLVASRERFGGTALPASRAGLKKLYQALSAGDIVGVLPDQEPRAGEGRFAPFFGVPALTGVLACRLARRTGARVLFATCIREPKGRYRMHYLPAEDAIRDADSGVALAALNRGVEACITLAPGQYLWAYKRFRQRPEGEQRFY